ncbi:hypothetical protein [Paenibacillus sp. TH7-28]
MRIKGAFRGGWLNKMEANIEGLLRILGNHHEEQHGIPEADIQAKEKSLGIPCRWYCGIITRL